MECRCGVDVVDDGRSCSNCGREFARKEEKMAKAKVVPIAKKVARDPREVEREEQQAEQVAKENEQKKRLEEIEEKIDGLRGEVSRVEWEIGAALRVIHGEDLWRLTGCASWGEYVDLKWGFTKQTAQAYMSISEMFSKERAQKIALTNLRLLTKIPNDEDREKITKMVEANEPTKRELEKIIQAKRAELGQQTTRRGFEGTVLINARVKVGPIADGKWKVVRGTEKRAAVFKIGDAQIVLEDLGRDADGKDLGFVVRAVDLAAAQVAPPKKQVG